MHPYFLLSATNQQDIETTKKPDAKDCKQGTSLKPFDSQPLLMLFAQCGFLMIDWVSKCSLSESRNLPDKTSNCAEVFVTFT